MRRIPPIEVEWVWHAPHDEIIFTEETIMKSLKGLFKRRRARKILKMMAEDVE